MHTKFDDPNFSSFYRAMLCVCTVFAVARCPSACLSVTFVYCIHMAEDIVKFLSPPGSPIILVFFIQTPVPNSKGEPLQRECKIYGGGEKLRFPTEIAVYLGNGTR